MVDEFLEDAQTRMEGAIRSLDEDLAGYRTGRASPRFLDKVVVEVYGVEMSLKQMANVSVPAKDPMQLLVRPFDAKSIGAIERAIIKASLGVAPNNNGEVIFLNMPRLTEERRIDLVKMVGRRIEDAKIAVRNVRRDVMRDFREMEKEKMITEDQSKKAQDDLQEKTDEFIKQIEELGKAKEEEIMEV